MKKRILSLLLAVILVFGVAVVPGVGADAAAKKIKYTRLTFADVNSNVTFEIAEANRAAAANQLHTVLNNMLKKGTTFVVTVNKKDYTATKTGKQGKGSVTVSDGKTTQTLDAFIVANKGKATSVTVSVNVKKVLNAAKLAKKKANFGYSIKVGDAVFSDLKISKKNKVTFNGNGKAFAGYLKNGKLYVKKNRTNSKFVKALNKSGCLSKVKVVKAKTASLAK